MLQSVLFRFIEQLKRELSMIDRIIGGLQRLHKLTTEKTPKLPKKARLRRRKSPKQSTRR